MCSCSRRGPFTLGSSMSPARLVDPWTRANNDTVARTVMLHPNRFAGVGALPLVPGQPVEAGFAELDRIVDLGFVGVLLNPDLHEGRGATPPLGDRYWYPLFERLLERDLPIHVHSAGCYSGARRTRAHFITEESIAILASWSRPSSTTSRSSEAGDRHGGGSVPYQIGRWQAESLQPRPGRRGPDGEWFEIACGDSGSTPCCTPTLPRTAVAHRGCGPVHLRHREARQRAAHQPEHRAVLRRPQTGRQRVRTFLDDELRSAQSSRTTRVGSSRP